MKPSHADSLYMFKSGNSLHGYVIELLSKEEWIAFMGNLLLMNFKEVSQVVDTRWVGHSLKRKYGSLRWTCNGSKYKRVPEFLGTLKSLEEAYGLK